MEIFNILGKTIIIFFLLIIIFRFLGKREVGELSIFDLVILLIIADVASIGIDNDEVFLPSVLSLFLLAFLQKGLSYLLLNKAKLRSVIDGSPTIIVYNGVIKIKNMHKELYTMDDLIAQMHQEHILDISEIRLAILETNGSLSIFRKSRYQRSILPIIISGEYVKENIKTLNVEPSKINLIFEGKGLFIKNVMYASYCDGKIEYYYRANKKVENLSLDTIVIKEDTPK